MRTYTKELLIGFRRLCDKAEARRARAREALGIAIVCEADIGTEDLRQTESSPWMRDVEASFGEMIDEDWVGSISAPENPRDYLEFGNAISEFYGAYTTKPKEILRGEYPFGDH